MVILLLLACEAEPPPAIAACTPSASTFDPADDTEHVLLDAMPTVTLEDPAAAPRLWMDGGVTGEWVEGAPGAWTFTPDAPLARDTAYTVLAEVCGVETASTFRTVGPAVGAGPVDRVYRMELDAPDIEWLAPTGADVIGTLAGEQESLLFQVASRADDRLAMVLAAGWVSVTDGRFAQDPCVAPDPFDADVSLDPVFTAGPTDVALQAVASDGQSFGLYQFVATGEFAPDAGAIHDLELSGLVDLSNLRVGAETACTVAESLGAPCEPCSDGAPAATCVRLRLRDPEAPAVDITFSETPPTDICR